MDKNCNKGNSNLLNPVLMAARLIPFAMNKRHAKRVWCTAALEYLKESKGVK